MRVIKQATDTTTASRSKPSKGQLIAGTVIAVFAIGTLASCLGGGSDSATAAAPAPAPVTVTVAPSAAPALTSAPAPVAPAAPVAPTSEAVPVVHYMPDVVGMNLQDAQDKIQEAGVFFSRSEDATGQGRRQILDRDWVVVAQNIEVGQPFGEGDAVLSVKRVTE